MRHAFESRAFATSGHREPSPFSPPVAARRLRLVVAHSEPTRRDFVASRLALAGHRVAVFADGVRLFEWLANALSEQVPDAPDLVVAEAGLRDLAGLDVLANLRYAGWSLPFIIEVDPGDERLSREAARLERRIDNVSLVGDAADVDRVLAEARTLVEGGPEGHAGTHRVGTR